MKRLKFNHGFLFLMSLLFWATLILPGCSSSDSPGTPLTGVDNPNSADGKGTVALMLADAPTDDYHSIWIWIKQVALIPANEDGEDRPQEIIFDSEDPQGHKVDLLDLRDQDFIFTVNENVPPGTYSKIRLWITDIQPEGGSGACSEIEVKLPSGKIDLLPQAPFAVEAERALSIRLDIDVDKSIKLKEAGQSGKCIFRPVVFVEINPASAPPRRCPRILAGTISQLYFENGDQEPPTRMQLLFNDNRSPLDVIIPSETIIFNQQGLRTDASGLAVEQNIHVRGSLNENADLIATEIVIGGVETAKGTVSASSADAFTLSLSNGAGSLVIDLMPETVILTDCNTPFTGAIIPPGLSARVYGKFDSSDEDNVFRALLVLLKPESANALLTAVDDASGGHLLTIDQGGVIFEAFLPDEAVVKMEGDGFVKRADLISWVACQGRPVLLVYDPDVTDQISLRKLIVLPDVLAGQISAVNPETRIITTADDTVSVVETATIFKMTGEQLQLIELDAVGLNQTVTAYGAVACPDDTDANTFYAFVLVVE